MLRLCYSELITARNKEAPRVCKIEPLPRYLWPDDRDSPGTFSYTGVASMSPEGMSPSARYTVLLGSLRTLSTGPNRLQAVTTREPTMVRAPKIFFMQIN
jgi:hypothetical protein